LILSLIKIKPHPRTRREILDILRNVECVTRIKTGCLGSSVYLKKFEEEVILYLELWQSRDYFERHIQSNLYDRILATLDLARDPPEVNFFEITELGSMEVIEAIRSRGTRTDEI